MSGPDQSGMILLGGRCILWVISQLVPRSLRREWRAEWMGELSVLASFRDASSLRKATQFLSGCLPDAFELRRLSLVQPSRKSRSIIDSPQSCLTFLACVGSMAGGAWLLLRVGAPDASISVSLTHLAMAAASVATSVMIAAADPADRWAAESAHGPARRGRLFYSGFFLLKTILAVGVAGLFMAALSALVTSGTVQPHGYLLAYYFACRWSIVDNRQRCPVCGWRTQYPVQIGTRPALLLDWVGTESLCPHGHGLMYVSAGSSSFPPHWWSPLDPSWSALFRPPAEGKQGSLPPSRA